MFFDKRQEEDKSYKVMVANESHLSFVDQINNTIEQASKERGTGIAKRSYEYVASKIKEGKAVIALQDEKVFAGFCYIETWGHGRFVANSGLIVAHAFRGQGVAKQIKKCAFELSRKTFPEAKIFGLTTGLAVMKINSELGYKPVTFSELTDDDAFWKGCQSCVNVDILERTGRTKCLCTGMLFDPKWEEAKVASRNTPGDAWRRWVERRRNGGKIWPLFDFGKNVRQAK